MHSTHGVIRWSCSEEASIGPELREKQIPVPTQEYPILWSQTAPEVQILFLVFL